MTLPTNLLTLTLAQNATHSISEAYTDMLGNTVAAPAGSLVFASDAPNIASVDSGGLITANGPGLAWITVSKGNTSSKDSVASTGYCKVIVPAAVPGTVVNPS